MAAASTAASAAPKLLGRFASATPVALFRVQGSAGVRLRLETPEKVASGASFDISAHEGFVLPRTAAGAEELFLGPNGMSVRPKGAVLGAIVANYRGARMSVYEVPEGTTIPQELVVLHEHGDHYSVQPAKRMTPKELNAALTAFLAGPTVIKMEGKEAFFKRHPDLA